MEDVNSKKLLNRFLVEAKLSGRREQGLIGLRSRIPKLFAYILETCLTFDIFGVNQALDYQGWLLSTGRLDGGKYSTRTIHSYLVAAGSFFDFLKTKGIVHSNPFKEITYLRLEAKLPRNILKEKDINKLLDYFSRYDEEMTLKLKIRRYRMHVLGELLYSTGLRISEAASLKVSDIDFSMSLVRVNEGKGGIARTVLLNDYTCGVLKIYVSEIRLLILTAWHDGELLFGTGWQQFGKWANAALKEASGILDLPGVTCHGFRHALGFHLLRSGCSIRSIQAILGHRSLRNTEIYTKVEKKDLKRILDTYHPRQWKKKTA